MNDLSSVIELSTPDRLMKRPIVSVLMLTYRHQNYLAEAIEGVLAQQCEFPIELIIAEDCSPDATRAIAEQYQRQRPDVIRIITGNENIGAMPNFYRALARSRGKYVAFCEGDDYWCDPDKLTKQVAILEADNEIGMVHGNFVESILVDGQWQLASRGWHCTRSDEKLEGDVFAENIACLNVRTCTLIVRYSVLDALLKTSLANPDFVMGDIQIVVYCAAYWKAGYVADIVAVYRHHPGSITRSGITATYRLMKSVSRLHLEFRKHFGGREDFDERVAIPFHVAYAKAAFRLNDRTAFEEARRCLSEIEGYQQWRHPDLMWRNVFFLNQFIVDITNKLIDHYGPVVWKVIGRLK